MHATSLWHYTVINLELLLDCHNFRIIICHMFCCGWVHIQCTHKCILVCLLWAIILQHSPKQHQSQYKFPPKNCTCTVCGLDVMDLARGRVFIKIKDIQYYHGLSSIGNLTDWQRTGHDLTAELLVTKSGLHLDMYNWQVLISKPSKKNHSTRKINHRKCLAQTLTECLYLAPKLRVISMWDASFAACIKYLYSL